MIVHYPLEYPLDEAMHPINSADITFQWRRAPGAVQPGQTAFRIRFRRFDDDVFELRVFERSTSGAPMVTP